MADLPKVRVMISSRSLSPVFASRVPLTEVRLRLLALLEGLRWHRPARAGEAPPIEHDHGLLEVWIHESDPGEPGDRNTFEVSLREIRRADVVLVLYTGEAGSAAHGREIGICHAELQEALSRRGDVVSMIGLAPIKAATEERDRRFQRFVEEASMFRRSAGDEDELQRLVLELLHERIAELVNRGARGGRRRDRGQALNWERLDLAERRRAMRSALAAELGIDDVGSDALVDRVALGGQTFTVRLDAIPGSLAVAAARELVGQPFLRDHLFAERLSEDAPGMVHVVACHRGATASQASKIVGTPDAITVQSDFGVYAADHVQKIQLVFLANCADDGATGIAVRRLNEWLRQTGEIALVRRRALARVNILRAIAAETEQAE